MQSVCAGDVDRALHVQRGVRAEDPAGWIEQKEGGTGNGGGNLSVHLRGLASGYAADDVVDGPRPTKGCSLALPDIEAAEAVEEIAANLLAQIGTDCELGSQQA